MRSFLVSFAFVLMTNSLGCAREKAVLGPLPPAGPFLAEGQVLKTSGTVRFVDIEGGCWALETDSGTYEPTSLPTLFRRDGLRVHLVVQGTRLLSFCQIGQVVTVDTIQAKLSRTCRRLTCA